MESISRRSKLVEARWKAKLAADLFRSGESGIWDHALRDAWHTLLDVEAVDAADERQLAAIRAVLDELALDRPALAA